jgi:hypothetical protein
MPAAHFLLRRRDRRLTLEKWARLAALVEAQSLNDVLFFFSR